jgi:DNA-binding PadR family transcriptional regulator
MSPSQGQPIEKLHPSGRQTIASMLSKGWIERRSDDHGRAVYCITAAGQEALKTQIPHKR